MNLEALKKYNKEVEVKAISAFRDVEARAKQWEPFSWGEYELSKITKDLKGLLLKWLDSLGNNDENAKEWIKKLELEEVPGHEEGHFALSMFFVAGKIGKKPEEVAQEFKNLLEKEKFDWLKGATVKAVRAYVNISLGKEYIEKVLGDIHKGGEKYGGSDKNIGNVAYFDFSHPNIAKPIGVGNMRSTIIGEALARIYEKVGYTVYRDNFLGDWGAQFGKLIYAYQTWGDEERVKNDPLKELKTLYVRFHEEEEKDPSIGEKAAVLAKQLENGDEELLILWERFREWSIEGFERLYARLGVKFDSYLGESFFVDKAEEAIEECRKKLSDIVHVDPGTGALVVEGLKEGDKELPSFILKKSDGSTIYISRDLAAMKFRTNTFHPQAMRFVVGNEQALNFRQLFALAQKVGYLENENIAKHVSFGLVMTDGKKMSTRKGTAVEFEEVLREAKDKARELMASRDGALNADLLDEVAEIVGTGAVIYNDLRQSRHRDIDFNWDKMLSFEGGSAAYLQYTAVRIQSILNNITAASGNKDGEETGDEPRKDIEFSLAWKLAWFPSVIDRAARLDTPSVIATYLEELAQLFNSFYGQVSIIHTHSPEVLESRIRLIQSVRQVLLNGLDLLNVKVPSKM